MVHPVGRPVVVVALAPAIDRYLWFDRFELGHVHRPQRTIERIGGKAINAARVLRQLGAGVTVVLPASSALTAELRSVGVEVAVVPVPGPLRQTSTLLSEADGTTTEIYEPSPGLDDAHWSALADAAVGQLERGAAAAVVSGSRPTNEAGASALGAVARAAGAATVPVYVDGRPSTVTAVLTAADVAEVVVKVNADEAAELVGSSARSSDLAGLAAAVVGLGATAAVVTAGEDGAVYGRRRTDGTRLETVAVSGPPRPGPSPGGSGDSFLAGLVAGRLRGLTVDGTLRLARRCAEANASQPLAGDLGGAAL